jgi:hypothetical protein
MSLFWKSIWLWPALAALAAGCPKNGTSEECGPPSASAGEDISGETGQRIVLRGTFRLPPDTPRCRAELDSVTFHWEQMSGTTVTLDGADEIEASFVPVEPGDYAFRCRAEYPNATDPSRQWSQWDTVQVTVSRKICAPPVAAAGEDQSLTTSAGVPRTVTLDGSGSRPRADCPGLSMASYRWTVATQPAGSDVSFSPSADAAVVQVALQEFGTYEFELEVQDDGGADGRSDRATDRVRVELGEKPECLSSLEVTVLSAHDGQPLAGAHVEVIDAAGDTHAGDADAAGVARFSGLAAGPRRAITAWSDERVAAIPLSGEAGERPRFEAVTVLSHCNSHITLPLRLSGSGLAARPTGRMKGKVPPALFDTLPHSERYAGPCQSDADCRPAYRCQNTPQNDKQCTPRSLLPFFSLTDPTVSGQFRAAVLVPLLGQESLAELDAASLFSRPLLASGLLPGNLASDDVFLNGISSTLGIPVWGDMCVSVTECPDTVNYTCETDPRGDHRCKDNRPLHGIAVEVPASPAARAVLLLGVIDVAMSDLLPVLMAFLNTPEGEEVNYDVGAVLGSFKMNTLRACPISAAVVAGADTDISGILAALQPEDCLEMPYRQQEAIEPVLDRAVMVPGNECTSDTACGWPASGLKCLADPAAPNDRYCLMPLFRVRLLPDFLLSASLSPGPFDPMAAQNDSRLCRYLPASARYEELCPGSDGPVPCDPRRFHDLPVDPKTAECRIPYGLSIATLDFPPQSPFLPDGGRALIGFNYNFTSVSRDAAPTFFMPDPQNPLLAGARISTAQVMVRNLSQFPDGSYSQCPGYASTRASAAIGASSIALPPLLPVPALAPALDSGLTADVLFSVVDPTVFPPQILRAYAIFSRLLPPATALSLPLSPTWPAGHHLTGVLFSRVNRIGENAAEDAVLDPLWRVYAPADAASLAPPAARSPFAPGVEVWAAPFAAIYAGGFDFDIFDPERLRKGMSQQAADGYAFTAP